MKVLLKPALFLFILFGSIYFLIQSGHIYSSDTNPRYELAKSITDYHRLSVPENINSTVQGKDGKYYSFYGIGQSILFIPLYLTGKGVSLALPGLEKDYINEFAASFINAVFTALTCILLFVFGLTIGYSKKTSFLVSLIYGFATIAIVYAKDSYEHPLEAFFILLAVFCTYLYVKKKNLKWLVISAVSMGFEIITRLPPIFLVPLIFGYVILHKSNFPSTGKLKKDLLVFGISILPFIIFILWYNYFRFGSIFETGYQRVWGQDFTAIFFTNPVLNGIYGLMFSPGKGLLFYTPVLILSLASWKFFHKKDKFLSLLFISIILFYILFYAKTWKGYEGWSWGPRYVFPVIPFIILPLGALMESEYFKTKKYIKPITTALILLSFIIQIPAVLVNYQRYLYVAYNESTLFNGTIINNPKYSHIIKQWDMLFEVISKMKNTDIRALSVNSSSLDMQEMLDKGRTMNIMDIWWVHLYYMNFSKILIVIMLMLLLIATFLSYYLFRKNYLNR